MPRKPLEKCEWPARTYCVICGRRQWFSATRYGVNIVCYGDHK